MEGYIVLHKEIPIEELKVNWEKPIATGGDAIIYVGEYMDQTVAIKQLTDEVEGKTRLLSEAAYVSLCSSSHVVKIYGAVTTKKLLMVMEICEHRSIYDVRKK